MYRESYKLSLCDGMFRKLKGANEHSLRAVVQQFPTPIKVFPVSRALGFSIITRRDHDFLSVCYISESRLHRSEAIRRRPKNCFLSLSQLCNNKRSQSHHKMAPESVWWLVKGETIGMFTLHRESFEGRRQADAACFFHDWCNLRDLEGKLENREIFCMRLLLLEPAVIGQSCFSLVN